MSVLYIAMYWTMYGQTVRVIGPNSHQLRYNSRLDLGKVQGRTWKGNRSSSADCRSVVLPAMIIRLTVFKRSPDPKNMCSVRTSPKPSAPFSRATFASSGVSAFARTFNRRSASTLR